MKRDPKPSNLTAVVPAWAQELETVPTRPLKTFPATGFPPASNTPSQALLRVDEAAAFLKVSSKTIRRLVARGDLTAVRIGRLVRIHFSEIDRLMAAGCPSGGDYSGGGGHD